MPVNRSIWKEPLKRNHVPDRHCPACNGGYLKQRQGSLHFLETSDSLKARGHEAWEPNWSTYRFSMLLICSNERCREPVAVIGTREVEILQTSFNDFEEIEYLYPKHVSPSPPRIDISDSYPAPVIEELRLSFIASWSDFSSAGNHIRSAVERLLDHLREPKTKLNKKSGKRERLTLHCRIKGLASRDKDIADSLLAVKWLGNQASHSEQLTQDDIYDALDILDVLLDDLFICHRSRIKKLVTTINKARGPARKRST